MSGYINTIADLEANTYGMGANAGLNNQLLKQVGAVAGIHTGHDVSLGVGSGTTAASSLEHYTIKFTDKKFGLC